MIGSSLRAFMLAVAASLAASVAAAQQVVTLEPRPGVSESFFIANMGQRQAGAVALLFIGGGGNIRLRTEGGQVRFEQGNFLPRSRTEFIRNNVLPVIMDNPTDQQAGSGMSDAFRASAEHVTDVRAVIGDMKRRYPGLPVFLVGTSRSTISVAWLARALGGEIAGAVLSSSLYGRPQRQVLTRFDWPSIRVPLLIVHHRDDVCPDTLYRDAARLADRYPLVSVKGGKPAESGPCDPLSPHGFFGLEGRTVDAMANWMFGRPYAKDIE